MIITGTNGESSETRENIRNIGLMMGGAFGGSTRDDRRGKVSERSMFSEVQEITAEGGVSFRLVGGSHDRDVLDTCESLAQADKEGDRITFESVRRAEYNPDEKRLQLEFASGDSVTLDSVGILKAYEPRS